MKDFDKQRTFINEDSLPVDMGAKVVLATLFSMEPVISSVTRIGPDRLILLVDKDASAKQLESLDLIKKSIGTVVDVKTVKVELYDIVSVATKCVEIIDMQPSDDSIYVNITSGRKPQAIGLLFASYARHNRVRKIMYLPEEKGSSVVYLPRLSFKLTDSQKHILEVVSKGTYSSITELAKAVDLSQGMLYRAIDELKDMDLLSTEEGITITDAGRIARL